MSDQTPPTAINNIDDIDVESNKTNCMNIIINNSLIRMLQKQRKNTT